ncbi:MAG: TIR domain-containing protein [Lachnospiraceae bacterium]|nr:TIR domain-containing protein [Lachnospiraceae bacterium]
MEDFIFISYAHKDAERVMPVVNKLKENGYRVWYDDEIHPGSEWPKIIGEHVIACKVFFAFISKNYVASKNCQRELTLAQSEGKEFVAIFLEEVELDAGMKLQLAVEQSVFMYKATDMEVFCRKLFLTAGIESCKQKEELKLVQNNGQNKKAETVKTTKTVVPTTRSGKEKVEERAKKKEETVDASLDKTTQIRETVDGLVALLKKNFEKQEVIRDSEIKTWNNLLEYKIRETPKETFALITGFSPKNTTLRIIEIPQRLEGYPVREIDIERRGVTWIASVIVPEGVTKINFAGCMNIQSITLPESVYEIGANAFERCDSLMEIKLPKHEVHYRGSLRGLPLYIARNLAKETYQVWAGKLLGIKDAEVEGEIVIPEGVVYIDNWCIRLSDVSKKITSITFPSSLVEVEARTFEGCSNLEYVTFEKGVKKIGREAFANCTALKDVRISRTAEMEDDAFRGCPNVNIIRY